MASGGARMGRTGLAAIANPAVEPCRGRRAGQMSGRIDTDTGRLIRAGLSDLDLARRLLASQQLAPLLAADIDGNLLADLSGAADPDLALLLLVRILEACDAQQAHRLTSALSADADLRRRVRSNG